MNVPHALKIKQARLFAAIMIMPLLAACSYTLNQSSLIDNVVQSKSLGNGAVLNVGYKLPDDAAQCQLVNETSRNWSVAQTVGQLKFGGGRQVLQDEAVNSVKQRPEAGINYFALIIPNEAGLGIVNVTALRDAKTSYFHCANPPQPH